MDVLNRRKNVWVMPLAVLAVAALIALNEMGFQRSTDAAQTMVSEQEKRSTLNALLQQVLDAETGQRGYLLTGDEKYLLPYTDAIAKIDGTLATLGKIYATDTATQSARLAALSRFITRKLAELEVTINVRRAGGDSENWMHLVRSDVGRDYMNGARDSARELFADAVENMGNTQRQIDRSLTVSRIGVTLAALLGLLAFHLYLRQTERLSAVEETQRKLLAHERIGLEEKVRERTARLTVLANHLQTAQEDEREHLARELHDELGALLTAAKLDVARIRSKMPTDNEAISQRFAHLTEMLNAGISLKRRIVEDLRPSSLTHLGLVAALEILVREFGEHTGIAVTTDLDAVELSDNAALTAYRVVQESLTNISKYAHAQDVKVTLQTSDHDVEVVVEDDGCGFNIEDRPSTSHGLAGMRHRVEALRGTLTVTSSIGQGATVRAVIPRAFLTVSPDVDHVA
ncbi:MAG TPA: CHASE3 domain-containing protein [Casimicrobium sp.]|nr:CHASE3 domain-containing protein [Casimicrobium sp.]